LYHFDRAAHAPLFEHGREDAVERLVRAFGLRRNVFRLLPASESRLDLVWNLFGLTALGRGGDLCELSADARPDANGDGVWARAVDERGEARHLRGVARRGHLADMVCESVGL